MKIGYEIYGTGPQCIIIMHDWFCDHTSYDAMRLYLDTNTYTYAFMDLRGYGLSKNIEGTFTLEEICSDVLTLADTLKWKHFHIIGHSMTGLVVQRLAIDHPDRLKSIIAITPVPASGMHADPETFQFMCDAATHNEDNAKAAANMMSGSRLSPIWVSFKATRWWSTSTAKARIGYLNMFDKSNFADSLKTVTTPILIIAGEHDVDGFNEATLKETMLQWLNNVQLIVAKNAAHYPMQETPVFLASTIESFIEKHY